MIKIQVIRVVVDRLSGTNKATGKPYNIANQVVYLHNGEDIPEKSSVPLILRDDLGNDVALEPYQPGFYTLDAASLRNGRYGPEIDNRKLKLVSLDTVQKAK